MKTLFRIIVTILALSLPTFSAVAIEADAAIALCKKNKSCKQTDRENGEVVLVVDGSIITCPLVGKCECTVCGGPAKIVKPGSKANNLKMSIPQLLRQ